MYYFYVPIKNGLIVEGSPNCDDGSLKVVTKT